VKNSPSTTHHHHSISDKPAIRITRRGEAKRTAILDVAASLFLSHGYVGVSVDEIVRASGGSKTNVYNYFGGKDGLFVAVVEALCDRFLEKTESLELPPDNTRQGLEIIAHSFLESLLQERHLEFMRLIFAEARRFPRIGQAWYARGPMATCNYIAAYLAQQQAGGARLNTTPESAAQFFHDMVIAGVMHRTLATGERPEVAQLDALIESATDLIVAKADTKQRATK